MEIIGDFVKTLERFALLLRGQTALVAYSGGMDSTVLTALFLEICEEWRLGLHLAHFNHKLRKNADRDEAFVRRQAESWGLPLTVGSADVRAFASEEHLNIEEAARLLRYRFLERTAAETEADRVATAHTSNDQAETFLMRIFRGSGRRGLAGVYPVVDGLIIRPLLFVNRKKIADYASSSRLEFRSDESNLDRRYLRNRIRLDLLPAIQKDFDPRIVFHLSQAAHLLREEEELLQDLVAEESRHSILRTGGRLTLDAARLSSLPRGLARRMIREFLHRLQGHLRRITFSDVERVLELSSGQKASLKRDLILIRDGDRIYAYKTPQSIPPYDYSWKGKEPLFIKEVGLKVSAHLRSGIAKPHLFDDSRRVYLDRDRLTFPLTVRSRREGDRYRPLGAPGTRKLKEILRTKGIAPADRDLYPVFESGGDIVWVYGLPVAERYKLRAGTRSALLITVNGDTEE